MSIERQIRVILGVTILVTSAIAVYFPGAGYWLTAGMGVSLVATGLMDRCGTRWLLSRMPWNRK